MVPVASSDSRGHGGEDFERRRWRLGVEDGAAARQTKSTGHRAESCFSGSISSMVAAKDDEGDGVPSGELPWGKASSSREMWA